MPGFPSRTQTLILMLEGFFSLTYLYLSSRPGRWNEVHPRCGQCPRAKLPCNFNVQPVSQSHLSVRVAWSIWDLWIIDIAMPSQAMNQVLGWIRVQSLLLKLLLSLPAEQYTHPHNSVTVQRLSVSKQACLGPLSTNRPQLAGSRHIQRASQKRLIKIRWAFPPSRPCSSGHFVPPTRVQARNIGHQFDPIEELLRVLRISRCSCHTRSFQS